MVIHVRTYTDSDESYQLRKDAKFFRDELGTLGTGRLEPVLGIYLVQMSGRYRDD